MKMHTHTLNRSQLNWVTPVSPAAQSTAFRIEWRDYSPCFLLLGLLLFLGMATPASATFFTDSFQDGNANGWTPNGGTWSVVTDGSYVYRQTNNTGTWNSTAGSASWSSYAVEARIKPLSFNGTDRSVSLHGRRSDANNHYYVSLRNSNILRLAKVVGGTNTILTDVTFTVTAGTWYKVRLEMNGTSIKVYVNGVLKVSATDSSLTQGAVMFGMSNATAEIDDVIVTEPWIVGFGASATGGAGGTTVTVTTATGTGSLTDYATRTGSYIIQVSGTITLPNAVFAKSNKTFVGIGTNPTISGARIETDANHSNFIFKNLRFTNSTPLDSIAVRHGGNKVWIDHCTFTNAADECIDISNGGDYVTISWCKFTFTSGIAHPILIGGSDDDPETYHVTVHNNWFSSGCFARMPRCRKGQMHVFNNYYDFPGLNNDVCVLVALESSVLLQNSYFNNVKYPWKYYTLSGQTAGKCRQSGNIFINCVLDSGGNDTVFTPPYSYTLQTADDARTSVSVYSGCPL